MNPDNVRKDITTSLREMELIMPLARMAGESAFEELCGLYAKAYLLTHRISKDTSC